MCRRKSSQPIMEEQNKNIVLKKYMVEVKEDGTEEKTLIKSISSIAPTKLQIKMMHYLDISIFICLYVVISAIFVYLCFKFFY